MSDDALNGLDGLFDRFLLLHQVAFAATAYSAAYHALAGALHCAGDAEDKTQLSLVEKLATDQLAWLDLNAPAYEHSTQSARTRGHASIYTMLAGQAHARVLMLHHQQDWRSKIS